jgi:8-oxo-dGTP pyrophosphatase MutT (NUDIX family)
MTEFPVAEPMDRIAPAPERDDIWCPHVTVACVVADGDRFLMVEEDIRGELRLNQPAGHLDDGETLAEAACRETLEETGWEIALDHFIGVQQWHSPVHNHHIVRFAFAGHPVMHHPARTLDAGITRALWLRYPEIVAAGPRLRSPLVLTTLEDWLAGQRLPLATLRSLLPAREA